MGESLIERVRHAAAVAKIELDYNVIENPLNPIFDKKTQKTGTCNAARDGFRQQLAANIYDPVLGPNFEKSEESPYNAAETPTQANPLSLAKVCRNTQAILPRQVSVPTVLEEFENICVEVRRKRPARIARIEVQRSNKRLKKHKKTKKTKAERKKHPRRSSPESLELSSSSSTGSDSDDKKRNEFSRPRPADSAVAAKPDAKPSQKPKDVKKHEDRAAAPPNSDQKPKGLFAVTPPSWSLAKISQTAAGPVALVGKTFFEIVLAANNPTYETTMIVTDVVEECQGWNGKRVQIGGIATATVISSNLPLKLFHKTATGGPLKAGSFLLGDVELIDPEAKDKTKKFKKNILVNLEGKSFETLPEALSTGKSSAAAANSVSLYVFSSVLTLDDPENMYSDTGLRRRR